MWEIVFQWYESALFLEFYILFQFQILFTAKNHELNAKRTRLKLWCFQEIKLCKKYKIQVFSLIFVELSVNLKCFEEYFDFKNVQITNYVEF